MKLDVPFFAGSEGAALVGGEVGVDVGVVVFEGALDEAAEAGGEGLVVDEEFVRIFWVDEGVVFGVEGDGGDDAVDVGMVLHLTSPGVEDGGEAELELRGFEFGACDVVEGLGGAFEKEAVEFGRAVEAKGSEFPGDGIEAKACSEMDGAERCPKGEEPEWGRRIKR